MLTPEQKSTVVHHLARFVTVEAIALHLKLQPQEIYRISCWRYVIHVVAKGISTFVSYADLPPIIGTETPQPQDINCWRKRWRHNKYKAPTFWVEFYRQKFQLALTLPEMQQWGQLVGAIKFALPETSIQLLRETYSQEQYWMDKF